MSSFVRTSLVLIATLLTSLGCSSTCSKSTDRASLNLQVVPFEPTSSNFERVLPEEYQLREGESDRGLTYTLDSSGGFTFTRTIEADSAFLGLQVSEESEPNKPGATLRFVEGPARRAGLRAGDRLLSVDGKDVGVTTDFNQLFDALTPGRIVRIAYTRNGQNLVTDLAVAKSTTIVRSDTLYRELETYDARKKLGCGVIELSEIAHAIVRQDSPPRDRSLLVAELNAGGPMFLSGVQLGDLLIAIDDVELTSLGQLRSIVDGSVAGQSFKLRYQRAGENHEAVLRVESDEASRSFNFLGLIRYSRRQSHRSLSVLWGLLMHSHVCYKLSNKGESDTSTSWGMAADLLSYHSNSNRTKLTLLWFFPISVGR